MENVNIKKMKHEKHIKPDLLSGVACLAFLPEPGATLGDGAGLFFCSTFIIKGAIRHN